MTKAPEEPAPHPEPRSALHERWLAAWPEALAAWSKFTRLRPPTLCLTASAAHAEGLDESFAMIRLHDQAVVVDLEHITALGLQDFAVEVLAHEIGHHVLAPATLSDHARTIARMRHALPTLEAHAPLVANLYTDLIINDRLQRSAGLRMAEVYRAMAGKAGGALWTLYLRMYEVLWSLVRGSLGGGRSNDRSEGDALLGARLVRSYARDWLEGAGRFASLLLPYLLAEREADAHLRAWFDTRTAGAGGRIDGLVEEDPGEREGAVHPALDPALNGDIDAPGAGDAAGNDDSEPAAQRAPATPGAGQAREPYQYGEILRAVGVELSDHDTAVRYYRERARPHLVPFPARRLPAGSDPLPEGLEPWDLGHPLDTFDGLQSVLLSPKPVPGMTTVQRVWGTSPGATPSRQPLDLDLYVDSSGSMADPQRFTSYPALAGAVMCLSALRAGARVQATLWSGKHQVTSTHGFVRDEDAILRVLTGYYGGGTAFPIHVLRQTWVEPRATPRGAHILVISDDGVSTMLDSDERGNDGAMIALHARERAGGGATLLLALPADWDNTGARHAPFAAIARARDELGYDVARVTSWDELVAFARAFGRRQWCDEDGGRR